VFEKLLYLGRYCKAAEVGVLKVSLCIGYS